MQEEIESKNDTIMIQRKEISEQSEYIEELQEKLDNARSYAEDVQSALDDGSFSDAYDAASDAESEADGMNEDGPDRGYTGYEDISRSINGVAL